MTQNRGRVLRGGHRGGLKMIEIRTLFTDWHEVTPKQARAYVSYILKNANCMPFSARVDYLNKKHLRGTTVEELMEMPT